ncbi:hypothetical protein J6590_027867 [Homalodisca vitripennis]|nr:hypothetical protein J6590_027867 [Homalodisca vitripennis]
MSNAPVWCQKAIEPPGVVSRPETWTQTKGPRRRVGIDDFNCDYPVSSTLSALLSRLFPDSTGWPRNNIQAMFPTNYPGAGLLSSPNSGGLRLQLPTSSSRRDMLRHPSQLPPNRVSSATIISFVALLAGNNTTM